MPRADNIRIKIRGQYYPDIIVAKVFAETTPASALAALPFGRGRFRGNAAGAPRQTLSGVALPERHFSGLLRHRGLEHARNAAQGVLEGFEAAGEGDPHMARRTKSRTGDHGDTGFHEQVFGELIIVLDAEPAHGPIHLGEG